MKLSLSNALLAFTLIAMGLAWMVDRSSLVNELSTERELKSNLMESIRFEERRNLKYIGSPAPPYSEEELKLHDATDQTYTNTGNVLELLALFNCRNHQPKNDVVMTRFAVLMNKLKCWSLEDLQLVVDRLDYDPRIVMDLNHPKHREFVSFLEDSLALYDW